MRVLASQRRETTIFTLKAWKNKPDDRETVKTPVHRVQSASALTDLTCAVRRQVSDAGVGTRRPWDLHNAMVIGIAVALHHVPRALALVAVLCQRRLASSHVLLRHHPTCHAHSPISLYNHYTIYIKFVLVCLAKDSLTTDHHL